MSTKTKPRKSAPAPAPAKTRVSKLQVFREHDADSRPDHLEDPDRYKGEKEADRVKYQADDAKRVAAWKNDEWHYVGIYVRAIIEIDFGGYKLERAATAESTGLWGIESDSDPKYFQEVAAEEFAALRTTLAALGVTDVPDLKTAEWKDA